MSPELSPDAPLVLCYDGSEPSRGAVRQAAVLFPGARAVVLTVWESVASERLERVSGAVRDVGDVAVEVIDELNAAGRTRAEQLAREGAEIATEAGLVAEPMAEDFPRGIRDTGNIAAALVARATELGARAILVGARGSTALTPLGLGSVSHAVLHLSRLPVVIMPPPAEADAS